MNPVCLHRARAGEALALQELCDLLRPRLARMAAYYAGRCPEAAADLLQEAWLGVFEALPRLDARIGDPVQFLLRYARWRLLDAVRRSLAYEPPVPLDAHGDAPGAIADALDTLNTVLFLARLSVIQRKIVACLLAGYTWREAGDALGCTSANVAYHVRRINEHYQAWQERARAAL